MTATLTAPITGLHAKGPTKTCAWCRDSFPTVPALLDHVVDAHLPSECAA